MAARQETKPVPPGALMQKSRAVIGFWLAHCMARPHMLDAAMNDLLPMVAEGALKPVVGGRYPLSDVRDAHEALRARRTTGKLVLDPSN
jgi:NADPH:quinone reductase-like Zn-dependent oxidoreductase